MSLPTETFVLFLTLFVLLFIIYSYIQNRIKISEELYSRGLSTVEAYFGGFGLETISHQQEDVFNISSRVQGQEHQWPTHDAHLSIDHITILNQMNKPPKYEDDPPSYEEAIRIAALNQQSGSSTIPSVIVVAPKPINTH